MTFYRCYLDFLQNLVTNSQWAWIKVLNILKKCICFKNIISDIYVYLMYKMKCVGELYRWKKAGKPFIQLASVSGSTQIQLLQPTHPPTPEETACSFQLCETHLIDSLHYTVGSRCSKHPVFNIYIFEILFWVKVRDVSGSVCSLCCCVFDAI